MKTKTSKARWNCLRDSINKKIRKSVTNTHKQSWNGQEAEENGTLRWNVFPIYFMFTIAELYFEKTNFNHKFIQNTHKPSSLHHCARSHRLICNSLTNYAIKLCYFSEYGFDADYRVMDIFVILSHLHKLRCYNETIHRDLYDICLPAFLFASPYNPMFSHSSLAHCDLIIIIIIFRSDFCSKFFIFFFFSNHAPRFHLLGFAI